MLFFVAPAPLVIASPPGVLSQTDIFVAGDGYPIYRIPTITTTTSGAIIALAEGRTGSDPGLGGDVDLVYKRSTDGGLTWSSMQTLDDAPNSGTSSSSTLLTDQTTGRVWALYNRFEDGFGADTSLPGTSNNTAWARYSDDHGLTWSAGTNISSQVKDPSWNSMNFGPAGSIQAQNGRLIVPAYNYLNGTRTFAIYSDDHGSTWQRGQLTGGPNSANESQVVELADGRIMMQARTTSPDDGPHTLSLSSDGAQTWTTFPNLGEHSASVHTSLERFSLKSAGDDLNRILWTGPAGPGRNDLSVRVSYDEGESFGDDHILYQGSAGYSDLSILADGSVAALWEKDNVTRVTFTRFKQNFFESMAAPSGPALVSFDAAEAGAGATPNESSNWSFNGNGAAMTNNGIFLLQDNTSAPHEDQFGNYMSSVVPNEKMTRHTGDYAIEFKVRPLTDMPNSGNSHNANLEVVWSDDTASYNISIDKDTDDAGTGTTGRLTFGFNDLSEAIVDIDWSVAHAVAITYEGQTDSFDVHLDGIHKATFLAAEMARPDIFPFSQFGVAFGDFTVNQNIDVAAEWYYVRILDTASISVPTPSSLALLACSVLASIGYRQNQHLRPL